MDPADLDTLAWRAVELAVQQRDDPRLIVATEATVPGPTATARLMAGLCNAAAGRHAVAIFGVDGTGIVGLAEAPEDAWIDRIADRFPGVVPVLASTSIDADGALIVALAVKDPGTLVVAKRNGRAIIPWFDGTVADRPPAAQPSVDAPPPARITVRDGWLEHSGTASGAATTTGTSDPGVEVWQGVLDIAIALPAVADDAAPVTDGLVIDDRAVSVTILADHAPSALSLDVQIHPAPGRGLVRTDTGVRFDPALPVRLYLATAFEAPVADRCADAAGAVRLLISVRLPGDERLAATMVTLTPTPDERSDERTRRWTVV